MRQISIDMDTDYTVRVLFSGCRGEMNVTGLNYVQAKRKFLFYVSACLEFENELDVRCVNIFLGKTCLRYYQNYSINERYNRKNLLS